MTEVEEEVCEVGTPLGQLIEDVHSDQVTGELQVAQVDPESVPDEAHQEVNTGDGDAGHLWPEGDKAPQSGVLAEAPPLLTYPGGRVDEDVVGQVAEDEEEDLVRTVLYVTLLTTHSSHFSS